MTSPPLSELVRCAAELCERRFGEPPHWISAAPGRVNLIGEHVDYNDGFVLPMAIERYVVVAGIPSNNDSGRTATFFSHDVDDSFEISLDAPIRRGCSAWTNYVKGIVVGFLTIGHCIPSLQAAIVSSVPLGSGLSSSASLEVAVATFLEAAMGKTIDRREKALLCQKAEHEFAGVPCGIMDQFSSVFGEQDSLLLLDCRSQSIEQVSFAAGDVTIVVINSNVKHELVDGEYANRRSQCADATKVLGLPSLRDATLHDVAAARDQMDNSTFRRARHVVSETERTVQAANAIRQKDWQRVGRLMYESHASLRDDFEVSCRELDLLVELAAAQGLGAGVFGSRMTGGGFGGCTVSLAETSRVDRYIETMIRGYETITGVKPTAFATRPAHGARIIRP